MEKYLEAVFELLADKVEDDWVYAGVDRREVDAKIIQDQQETANGQSFIDAEHWRPVALHRSFKVSTRHSPEQLAARGVILGVTHLSENPAEVQREPAERKDEDQAEDGFSHLPPLQRNTSSDDVREGLMESRGNDDTGFSARHVLS